MADLTIVTNNCPRDVLYWQDLTTKEQAEFDYLDTEDRQAEAQFVRYRGWVYDLHDTEYRGHEGMPRGLEGWSNFLSDSYFSGILIRWVDNYERVIVGCYYCCDRPLPY